MKKTKKYSLKKMSVSSKEFISNIITVFSEISSNGKVNEQTMESTISSLDILLNKMSLKENNTKFCQPAQSNQSNCASGGCIKILKSGLRKDMQCGAKVKPGYDVCNSHIPKEIKEANKAIKNMPGAQITTPVTPVFNFKAASFTSVDNNSPSFVKPGESGNSSLNISSNSAIPIPSFITKFGVQKKAPEFFHRLWNDTTLIFCEDSSVSNLIFSDNDGSRFCVGSLSNDTKIDKDDSPLPIEFGENVEYPAVLTDEQKKLCSDNSIQI